MTYTSIHGAIIDKAKTELDLALIQNIPLDDPARAGVVSRGPLQGDPDPDEARISVVIQENDPDRFYGSSGSTAIQSRWEDEVVETECGGVTTWARRFTVKARCLLVNTQETKDDAQSIADTVRHRIERTLLRINWAGVFTEDEEYVSRGCNATSMSGEAVQAGGPPDAYDYHIKVRFEVLTTTGVIP